MDLNAAAIFVRVMEEGSFTAAARALGIPKTTASKKIADLEAALGIRLLNRTTRRLSLTEIGEQVHGHYVSALADFAAAERAVEIAQQAPAGLLKIGGPGPVTVPFLMPAILAFIDAHPAIEVAHLSIDSPDLANDDRIDVLLAVDQGERSDPRDRAIAMVEVGLFASAAYIARHGLPAFPAELSDHAALAPSQAMNGNRFAWTLARDGVTETVAPKAKPRLRSNDAAALAAAAAAGYGIAALSLRLVQADAGLAHLVHVLPQWQVPGITLYARRRDGASASLKNRLFVDFVTKWFQDA